MDHEERSDERPDEGFEAGERGAGAASGEPDEARAERAGGGRAAYEEPCGHRGRRHRRHRHHGRKERVLHTRVSEQLSDDIRRLAEDLRVPASNLVRNVLEEVFAVVETVSDDVGDLFDDLVEEADAARERLGARERRGRRHRRHRGRGHRRARRDFDADVEAELREDERRESGGRDDAGAARETAAPPPREPEPAFPEVLGWQPLVLNHARTCARCGVDLARGRRAFVGLTAGGLSDVTLCRACVGS